MNYWSVPPMWAGRTVAVLASGPSMSQAVADAVRHLPRIAINTTYRLAPDADVIYGSDACWWAQHPETLGLPGRKVCIEILPEIVPVLDEAIQVMRNTGREGFDHDPACLRTINNSGACGIQIAVHAKAARVLLLGFDMHGGHWHGAHPKPLSSETTLKRRPGYLERCVASMGRLARALPKETMVINCTLGSALRCFPFVPLAEALADLREAA